LWIHIVSYVCRVTKYAPNKNRQLATISQSEGLVVKIAELKKEREADTEKLQWLDKAQAQLEDVFRSLSSQVLQSNTDTFLQKTESQVKSLLSQMRGDWTTQKAEMQNLVSPLENSLAALAGHIRDLEQKKCGIFRAARHAFSSPF
jgi:chromosome segregation ATPase